MSQPATPCLDGTMIAVGVSVAMFLFGAVGPASAKGGSPSFYLNTFASLQKIHARVHPFKIGRRPETNIRRRKYTLAHCD